MNSDKIPLELVIELKQNYKLTTRMIKTVYAGFIPQHGMEIMDTEIFFRVRTTALAGLQTLKHTADPLTNGKYIEGNRKITSKLFPKDEEQFKDSLEFFLKKGWKVEK